MSKYVVIDLEMCNVPYNDRRDWLNCNNEIIEIGAVLLDESLKICDSFKTYVHPEYGALDSVISDLTGITNVDLFDAPDCKKALTDFMNWVPKNAIMVTWSENDENQIRKEIAAKSIRVPRLKEFLNTCIDCQKTFGEVMYSKRNYNLVEALNISSIDYDPNVHDALVDAKNTALIFAKMQKEKGKEYKLSPYISIGSSESSVFTPFADLLTKCYA